VGGGLVVHIDSIQIFIWWRGAQNQ